MLVLTRKRQEQIDIGGVITLTIIKANKGEVRIGIDAPPSVRILRKEIINRPAALPTGVEFTRRPLNPSPDVCEGTYPEGMTQEQVEAIVAGPNGGRFTAFEGGKFRYIAYTA